MVSINLGISRYLIFILSFHLLINGNFIITSAKVKKCSVSQRLKTGREDCTSRIRAEKFLHGATESTLGFGKALKFYLLFVLIKSTITATANKLCHGINFFVLKIRKMINDASDTHPHIQFMAVDVAKHANISSNIKVYIRNGGGTNAWTGSIFPNYPWIVVTISLADSCSYDEICGVIAHEVGHIKHNEIFWEAKYSFAGIFILNRLMTALFSDRKRFNVGHVTIGHEVSCYVVAVANNIVSNIRRRNKEYAADKFSAQMVGATGQWTFLTRIANMEDSK